MFFYLSKILWFIAAPGNLLLLALCTVAILIWTKWVKAAKLLIVFIAICSIIITTLPIGSIILNDLENRCPRNNELPKTVSGIIVLGGVIDQYLTHNRQQTVINGAVERLTEFAHLSKVYPNAKLVFSGGSGVLGKQKLKEANFVGPLLSELGIAADRIIYEHKSRNTHENAIFSNVLLKPEKHENWILISSAFHMPRAIGCFRKAGWNVLAYPVDYQTKQEAELTFGLDFRSGLSGLTKVVHEWMGLVFYWLTNKTTELYPKP